MSRLMYALPVLMGLTMTASQAKAMNGCTAPEPMRVLDRFMDEFNARDLEGWLETYHFPHVRLSASGLDVWQTPADVPEDIFERMVASGWDFSEWGDRNVVQCGEDKAHIALTFIRYDSDEQPIHQFQSLYIVTYENGRWGVKARSSFAP